MEWCWVFCCKLERFSEKDKNDILALLPYLKHPALSIAQKGNDKGAAEELWSWIKKSCPLQIMNWEVRKYEARIQERIAVVVEAFSDDK